MRWYERKFRAIRSIAEHGTHTWDSIQLNSLMVAIRDMCESAIERERRAKSASSSSDSNSGANADSLYDS